MAFATGDATFRAKSEERVLELAGGAKAIVLVTHDMEWVREYCNRAVFIEHGQIAFEGEPDEVVALHRQHTVDDKKRKAADASAAGLAPVIAR